MPKSFGKRASPAAFTKPGNVFETEKVIDHCPAYDQFSVAFYLKTNTITEKISQNRTKMLMSVLYSLFEPPYILNGLSIQALFVLHSLGLSVSRYGPCIQFINSNYCIPIQICMEFSDLLG